MEVRENEERGLHPVLAFLASWLGVVAFLMWAIDHEGGGMSEYRGIVVLASAFWLGALCGVGAVVLLACRSGRKERQRYDLLSLAIVLGVVPGITFLIGLLSEAMAIVTLPVAYLAAGVLLNLCTSRRARGGLVVLALLGGLAVVWSAEHSAQEQDCERRQSTVASDIEDALREWNRDGTWRVEPAVRSEWNPWGYAAYSWVVRPPDATSPDLFIELRLFVDSGRIFPAPAHEILRAERLPESLEPAVARLHVAVRAVLH